jgi:hypothetical protein
MLTKQPTLHFKLLLSLDVHAALSLGASDSQVSLKLQWFHPPEVQDICAWF